MNRVYKSPRMGDLGPVNIVELHQQLYSLQEENAQLRAQLEQLQPPVPELYGFAHFHGAAGDIDRAALWSRVMTAVTQDASNDADR